MCPGRGKLDVWFLVVFLPRPAPAVTAAINLRQSFSVSGHFVLNTAQGNRSWRCNLTAVRSGLHENSALLLPTRRKKPQSSVAHLEADLILGLLGVLLDGVGGGHGGGVDVGVVGDDEPAAGEGYKVLVRIFTI